MRPLDQLLSLLTPTRRTTPLITTVADLDQAAIERWLRVEQQARREGRVNRPVTTADGPDANEQAIVSYYRGLWWKAQTWYCNALKREEARQDEAAAHWAPERVTACEAAAHRDLRAQEAAFREPLRTAWCCARQAQRDLRAFRAEHGVAREAIYPASRSLHYAGLLGMVAVEALANAYFFAKGSDYGLVGGFLDAVLVASFNVVVSFQVGRILHWLQRRGVRRLLAGVAGGLGLGLLGLYHLTVGHYRMALVGPQPDQAAVHALRHLIQAPLEISDLQTCMLIFVGVLCAVGAAVAGYTSDDPLPGYGAVTRRVKAAEAAYQALKAEYLQRLHVVVEAQSRAVALHVAEARAALRAFRASLAEAQQLRQGYALLCRALVEACRATQRRYRTGNEEIRDTETPAYFATTPPPPFTPDEALAPELVEPAAGSNDLQQRLATLEQEASAVQQRLLVLYQATLQAVPTYLQQIETAGDASPPGDRPQAGAPGIPTPQQEVPTNGVPHCAHPASV